MSYYMRYELNINNANDDNITTLIKNEINNECGGVNMFDDDVKLDSNTEDAITYYDIAVSSISNKYPELLIESTVVNDDGNAELTFFKGGVRLHTKTGYAISGFDSYTYIWE